MATMSSARLTGQQIADAGLEGWTFLGTHLATRLRTGDFATGLALLDEIGAAAEEANHHPDLDLRYVHLDVRLTSHDSGGVTDRDVRMARRVGDLAARRGVVADPAAVARIDLALDTPDRARVLPFWSAALGMAGGPGVPDDEIRDPAGAHPVVWFQASGAEEPRQRWHLDVWVDPGQVQARIDAALAAGGQLVSDAEAPSFWVLADADGNKVCLCTWQERARKGWE
jgi:4a-hydroxytetrahydrobiopterin dehydratase